jgi:Ca2+/Na+ antiporter
MSFREKSAWVTLFAILFVSALFAAHSPRLSHPGPWDFHALLACVAAFGVIEGIAFLVLRLRYPQEARTPLDERERLINLKATRLFSGFYVAGSFLAVLTLHHGATAIMIGYFVLLAFVIAEIVKYSARILYYRRGV